MPAFTQAFPRLKVESDVNTAGLITTVVAAKPIANQLPMKGCAHRKIPMAVITRKADGVGGRTWRICPRASQQES
jgi:hypothetical protein